MKKVSVLGLVLLLGLGMATCAGKKKQNISEKMLAKNPPLLCKFSRIEVKPSVVDSPEVIIKSGKQVSFSATAYDSSGKEVPANFTWAFRGLPQGSQLMVVDGHKLEVNGNTATFTAEGLASGEFRIAAEDDSCVDQNGRNPRGVTKVFVYPAPSQQMFCGPISIMLGEQELTDETTLGFISFNLKANIYGPKKLKGYRVNFYIGKEKQKAHMVKPSDSLIYNKNVKAYAGQEAYYWAYTPVWLANGDWAAYYELVKDGKAVCSSTPTYFTTR